jgi:hypothetical protein
LKKIGNFPRRLRSLDSVTMKTLIVFGVVLCATVTLAREGTDPTFDRLAKVDIFAFGGIGYAGMTSPGEKDYRLILSRTSAEADFERLFLVGQRAGEGTRTRRTPRA